LSLSVRFAHTIFTASLTFTLRRRRKRIIARRDLFHDVGVDLRLDPARGITPEIVGFGEIGIVTISRLRGLAVSDI
jgi:hypothetical protein